MQKFVKWIECIETVVNQNNKNTSKKIFLYFVNSVPVEFYKNFTNAFFMDLNVIKSKMCFVCKSATCWYSELRLMKNYWNRGLIRKRVSVTEFLTLTKAEIK